MINTYLSEDQVLGKMQKYLGIPYRRGGSSRKGTDCSGLIRQMYGELFSLDLPHNAAAQKRFIKDVPREDLKAGDLVFFGAYKGRINHIGAYLSNGKFIHASSRSGVTISSLSQPYWRKRFICSGRIKGLEIASSEGKFNDGNREHQEDAIQWNLAALESDAGSGLSSDVSVDSFFDFNVETFSLLLDQEPFKSTFFDSNTGRTALGGSRKFTLRQGVKLSTDWALFDWLQVAPYWTYVLERDQTEEQLSDVQSMGLSAEIAHPNMRWSISLAAQPPLYALQSEAPAFWDTDWREMDLFFGCRYHVSDTWKISFYGSGNAGTMGEEAASINSSRLNWLPDVEDMTLRLDYSF